MISRMDAFSSGMSPLRAQNLILEDGGSLIITQK